MSIIFSENNSLCAAPPPYTHCTYRQKGAVRQQGLGGASSPSAHEPCGRGREERVPQEEEERKKDEK